MWARMAHYQGKPQQMQTTIARIQAEEVPALHQLIGFSGGFWVVNREYTRGLNLTLWENEEALALSARMTQVPSEIGGLPGGVEQVNVRSYEVLAWTMFDRAASLQARAVRLGTFLGSFPGQRTDEHLRYLQEEFIDFIKLLPGHCGDFWLVDRPAGDMISFSVWASREDIEHGSQQIKQRAQQRLAAGGKPGPVPDSIELFDVWKPIWPTPVVSQQDH